MGSKSKVMLFAVMVCGFTFGANPAFAGQYHFFVENATDTKIVGLEASEDGETWGTFDLGKGIGAGKTIKLVWNDSTDGQSCEQMLKAIFADGSESESDVFNFCEDLDDPIIFE